MQTSVLQPAGISVRTKYLGGCPGLTTLVQPKHRNIACNASQPMDGAAGNGQQLKLNFRKTPVAIPNVIKEWVVPLVLPSSAFASAWAYSNLQDVGLWALPCLLAAPAWYYSAVPWLDAQLGPQELRAEDEQDTSATTWSSRAAPVACLSLYLSARLLAYTAMAPAHSAAAALTDTLTSSLSDTAAVTAAAGGFAVPEGLAFAMLVYTLVVSSTPSISASHELIHSKVPAHGLLAEAFLVMGFIHPFYRAHHQHHLHVGTPADYTSAPRGMPFWPGYMIGYMMGSYRDAWQLDEAECKRKKMPVISMHNRSLVGWLSQFGVLAGVWGLFGPTAAAVHVGIACMTILFLTSFDYALHYGLVRQPLEHDADVNMASSGTGASSTVRYNPVTPFTSWNSAYQIESAMLFNVVRHSQHHMASSKGYKGLSTQRQYPTFPLQSAALANVVLSAEDWFKMMDPLVDEVNKANAEYLEEMHGHGLAGAGGQQGQQQQQEGPKPVAA